MEFFKQLRGIFEKGWLIKSLVIMKLTFIIVLISCMQVSAKSYSQTLTLNLKSVELKKALATIEKNSNFRFLYSDRKIANIDEVNINVTDACISKVMEQLLTGTGLSYKELGNNLIVLVEKNEAVQDVIVKGKVTDKATGKPLAEASIQIKGSNFGTTADADGNYSINAPDQATLMVSSVGYDKAEIQVNGQTVINISLELSTTGLNEVVVVGFGTQKEKNITSAITVVNTKLLDDRSLTNLSTALKGITPGVYIQQQNGRPGQSGASSFNIRGSSLSTFSSNPPLVIIDGVVDDIDDINPNDVASVSILKDAAASAIYGARATGGVVLITTKRGAAGKLSVSYNGMYGHQTRPFGVYKFVNSETWMKANNEAAELDGSPDVFTAAQIAKYTNSRDPQFPENSQWASWIAKTAPQQTHNISIRGGSNEISFFLSGGLLKQGGFIPHDNYSRKNVLLNLGYHHNKLKISANIAYLRDDQTVPAYGGGDVYSVVRNAIIQPPTRPLYYPDGTFDNDFGGNAVYEIINGGTSIDNQDNVRMSLSLDYEILKGLFLDITTATKLNHGIHNTLNARFPFLDANGNVIGYNLANTNVNEAWTKRNYVNNQFLLNYSKNIGQHEFHIMGGITYEDEYDQYILAMATQFPNNEIREISGTTGSGSQITGTTNASEWAINSVIGRLNYSYKDKYLFQATGRVDGSSRFSPDHKWGFFPSVSGAWRIKQEPFLKDVNFISNLKLRASWGQLGNQGSNLYPFAQAVSFGGRAVFGNGIVSTATLGGPANLGLTWEKQTSENVGLDFGFLDNRLSGSFDHFNVRTNGIIGNSPAPSTFGSGSPLSNLYTIEMRGFELEINWRDQIGAFSYFAGFNLSNSIDKVVNLSGLGTTNNSAVFGKEPVVLSGESYMQVGKARNQWYLYKTDGLFVSQDEIDNSATQTSLTRPGDIHYVDANGDGKINSNDLRPLGKTLTPHYIFGVNLGIAFKNFDLSAVINGVWERWDLSNAKGGYLSGLRPDLSILQDNYDRRWTEEDPNQWAQVPRLTSNNWIGNLSNVFQDSEYWLKNFGYLRVTNLQIGYTLPKAIINKLSIAKARIYISAENLFTYTPGYFEHIDPESSAGYIPTGSLYFGPNKLVSFGVNVTF